MTSPFARNHVKNKLDRDYYMQATKEGLPLQGQVPQTYQRYSGVGSESINFDGSARVVFESDLAGGPLSVDINNGHDMHGRVINLVLTRTLQNDLVINYPDGKIHTPGTDATTTSFTIRDGQVPAVFEFDFWSIEDVTVSSKTDAPGPPVRIPGALYFRLDATTTNTLDPQNARRIQWSTTSPSFNNTTLTIDANRDTLTVQDEGVYHISYPHSYYGNLDRAVRTMLATKKPSVATVFPSACHTVGGLVTQNGLVEATLYLTPGEEVWIQSQYAPGGPAPSGGYGLMNGQTVETESNVNALSIIQL